MLTWVEGLQGVEGGRSGQLEGQRGQRVLLPEDGRLALVERQDLGVLVQGEFGMQDHGRALQLLLLQRRGVLMKVLHLPLPCNSATRVSQMLTVQLSRADLFASCLTPSSRILQALGFYSH